MKYDDAVYNLNNGLNAQVNSANDALQNAKTARKKAKQAYDKARNARNAAKTALDMAEIKYTNTPNQTNLDARNTAKAAYAKAVQDRKEASAEKSGAQSSYKSALKQRTTAVNAAKQEIASYKKAMESSEVSADTYPQEVALENMQKQLGKAKVISPIEGTVTVANVIEGGTPQGMMFLIEDMNAFEIKTTIKEYDVNRVKPGMTVNIQSDGTGDEVYEGRLASIAPAALSSASSELGAQEIANSNVAYDAVVEVTSSATSLRLGMNVRLNIILDQKDEVFAVPYDAVVENAVGEKVIYAANSDNGKQAAYQEITVDTGMETDFYIEVSGANLTEGILIVTNPDALYSPEETATDVSSSGS
jgi:hypothetical protein